MHAVVAVRQDVKPLKETLDFLRGLRLAGLEQINSIVKDYSGRTGMDVTMCEDYLQNKIIYNLGEEELEGLLHFRDLCQENQLIPDKHPVTFIQ